MLYLATLTGLTSCFILRLAICQVNFFFHRHKNLYLLFYPRFSLILFIFLVLKLIVILFDVKAIVYLVSVFFWHFSSATVHVYNSISNIINRLRAIFRIACF